MESGSGGVTGSRGISEYIPVHFASFFHVEFLSSYLCGKIFGGVSNYTIVIPEFC